MHRVWSHFCGIVLLISLTIAQETKCDSGPFNATGITPFRFDSQQDDWYSLATIRFNPKFGNSPDDTVSTAGILKFFASVPPGQKDRMGCQYLFPALNLSATGPGLNGCEGIVSQECIDRLTALISSDTAKEECTTEPIPERWYTESRDVCGDQLSGGRSTLPEGFNSPIAFGYGKPTHFPS